MKLLILASLFFGAAAHAHLDAELHHVQDELPAIEVIEQKNLNPEHLSPLMKSIIVAGLLLGCAHGVQAGDLRTS